MRTFLSLTAVAALGISSAGGCSSSSTDTPTPATTDASHGAEGKHDHEHDHPDHGPHNGQLIELGKEEYHGEIIHDDADGTVTIYLLDGKARDAVAIEASELRVNVKQRGKGKQFELAAVPQESDEQGRSSRFVSKDKELGEDLDREGAQARLVVEINGKSYTGEITHSHGEDGHHH